MIHGLRRVRWRYAEKAGPLWIRVLQCPNKTGIFFAVMKP